jgi:hypothetical protein
MAKAKKTAFPKIAEKNWWKLRERFKQKVPAVVTTSYLAPTLNMADKSARANVLGPLKMMGLINDDGTPTDLAYDWRDDKKYSEVCEKMRKNLYPQELHDAFPTAEANQNEIEGWFMNYSKVGVPAANMYASFYKLLLQADPSKSAEALKEKPTKRVREPEKMKVKKAEPEKPVSQAGEEEGIDLKGLPSLHIDIQIHIAPDASPEQIDKIFSSMARHLKGFRPGSS